MRTCKRCFLRFDEEDVMYASLETELAETFLQDVDTVDMNDLCPECMEELGAMNLSTKNLE
jgi:hypothetical protein